MSRSFDLDKMKADLAGMEARPLPELGFWDSLIEVVSPLSGMEEERTEVEGWNREFSRRTREVTAKRGTLEFFYLLEILHDRVAILYESYVRDTGKEVDRALANMGGKGRMTREHLQGLAEMVRQLEKMGKLLGALGKTLQATSRPQRPPRPQPPQPQPRPRPPTPPTPPRPKRVETDPGRRKELGRLLEELKRKKKEQEKREQELNPLIEALRNALRAKGKLAGQNTFEAPDEEGFPSPPCTKLSPSMDPQKTNPDKLAKAPAPLFTIEPPLGGYYRDAVLDSFDMNDLEWRAHGTMSDYPDQIAVPNTHKISGKIRGTIALPLPVGYMIDPNTLKGDKGAIRARLDSRGIVYLESAVPQSYEVGFGKSERTGNKEKPAKIHTEDVISGPLSQATEDFLNSVRHMSEAERTIAIAGYVKNNLEYSQEDAYNAIYKSDSATYFQKIETHKKADCDVSNGYFIALCRRAGVAARMALGYRADGARGNKVELTRPKHAWAEIWDGNEWKSIDVTPPGEPKNEQGEALDPNCPKEDVDLPTAQPPGRDHPDDRLKELEDALDGSPDESIGELENRLKEVQDAKQQALEDEVQQNINFLKEEAARLRKEKEAQMANDLDAQASKLEQAFESYRADPNNTGGLKAIMEEASSAMDRVNRVAIGVLKIQKMLDKARSLHHR